MSRQAGATTTEPGAVTKEMIEAGVYEAKEWALGEDLETLVWRVYIIMYATRHKNDSTSLTNELK